MQGALRGGRAAVVEAMAAILDPEGPPQCQYDAGCLRGGMAGFMPQAQPAANDKAHVIIFFPMLSVSVKVLTDGHLVWRCHIRFACGRPWVQIPVCPFWSDVVVVVEPRGVQVWTFFRTACGAHATGMTVWSVSWGV